MADDLTDEQIRALVEAPKELPPDYEATLKRVTVRQKHKRAELAVDCPAGRFVVKLRENTLNPFEFSAILGYRMPGSTRVFLLRRYNGRHGGHTNKLERERISGFHIHKATARYQALGKEDAFAEATDRYATLDAALTCLLRDCNFLPPQNSQPMLFDSGQLWTT